MMDKMMDKKFEIREHSQGIFDLTFVANTGLFTGSADNYIVLWDLDKQSQSDFVVKTSVPAYSLASSGELLFIGLNNGDLHWVDLKTKQEVKFFQQHRSPLFRLVYDTKNKRLISADADGFVGVWDTEKLTLDLFFQLPGGKIRALCLNHDSSLMAVGAYDGQVYIFETDYFNEIHHFYAHQDGVTALAFHPDGGHLVSGGKDAYLRIWKVGVDAPDWSKVKAFPAHLYAIYGIQFSPDGTLMATCSRDKTLKLWRATDFAIIEKLDFKAGGHQHSVNAILWNEAGLFSVSDDRRLICWGWVE